MIAEKIKSSKSKQQATHVKFTEAQAPLNRRKKSLSSEESSSSDSDHEIKKEEKKVDK